LTVLCYAAQIPPAAAAALRLLLLLCCATTAVACTASRQIPLLTAASAAAAALMLLQLLLPTTAAACTAASPLIPARTLCLDPVGELAYEYFRRPACAPRGVAESRPCTLRDVAAVPTTTAQRAGVCARSRALQSLTERHAAAGGPVWTGSLRRRHVDASTAFWADRLRRIDCGFCARTRSAR